MLIYPTKNRVFCPAIRRTKMLFETEKKALNFIKFNGAALEELNGYAPKRAYLCPACGGWHLTHLDQQETKPEPRSEDFDLANLKPRDTLESGIRYHLSEVIRLVDTAVENLMSNDYNNSNENWKSISDPLREAIGDLYDIQTTPYGERMKSVQNLLLDFSVDLLKEINRAYGGQQWPIEEELKSIFKEDWENYMSFLGYLKETEKAPDNPRIALLVKYGERVFPEKGKYIKCLYELRRAFISKSSGRKLNLKTFHSVIGTMTDETLKEDLLNLLNNNILTT